MPYGYIWPRALRYECLSQFLYLSIEKHLKVVKVLDNPIHLKQFKLKSKISDIMCKWSSIVKKKKRNSNKLNLIPGFGHLIINHLFKTSLDWFYLF